MDYKLPDIRGTVLSNKSVFLLADLDVPLIQQSTIEDDTRLVAAMPTIEYLLSNGVKVVMAGKLGRPHGVFDPALSLFPVAEWMHKKLKTQNSKLKTTKVGGFDGWEITEKLYLLENLRFYPGEEQNDSQLAQKLASLGNVYVNDAFALCHRNHASVVGIPRILPHFAGLHLLQEVNRLSQVLKNPKRPLVAIIAGVKIETKLPLVRKMQDIANYVLVGGKIAQEIKGEFDNVIIAKPNSEETDISEQSLKKFIETVSLAKTIIWNGPLGKINGKSGGEDTEKGTRELAGAIIKSRAYTVVGGGDTTEFLKRNKLWDKFDFVSTGGGAMLSFLSGEKLPGLEALVG